MDTIEILKKYCKQKYGEEVVIKTYSIQEVKDIIDFTKKQCDINDVVVPKGTVCPICWQPLEDGIVKNMCVNDECSTNLGQNSL